MMWLCILLALQFEPQVEIRYKTSYAEGIAELHRNALVSARAKFSQCLIDKPGDPAAMRQIVKIDVLIWTWRNWSKLACAYLLLLSGGLFLGLRRQQRQHNCL